MSVITLPTDCRKAAPPWYSSLFGWNRPAPIEPGDAGHRIDFRRVLDGSVPFNGPFMAASRTQAQPRGCLRTGPQPDVTNTRPDPLLPRCSPWPGASGRRIRPCQNPARSARVRAGRCRDRRPRRRRHAQPIGDGYRTATAAPAAISRLRRRIVRSGCPHSSARASHRAEPAPAPLARESVAMDAWPARSPPACGRRTRSLAGRTRYASAGPLPRTSTIGHAAAALQAVALPVPIRIGVLAPKLSAWMRQDIRPVPHHATFAT